MIIWRVKTMDDGLVLSDKCLFTGPENWTYCTACVNSVAKCIILLNTLHKNFKNLNKKKKENNEGNPWKNRYKWISVPLNWTLRFAFGNLSVIFSDDTQKKKLINNFKGLSYTSSNFVRFSSYNSFSNSCNEQERNNKITVKTKV